MEVAQACQYLCDCRKGTTQANGGGGNRVTDFPSCEPSFLMTYLGKAKLKYHNKVIVIIIIVIIILWKTKIVSTDSKTIPKTYNIFVFPTAVKNIIFAS